MIDHETLDTAGQDLEQARARIEAAREALQASLDGQAAPEVLEAIARLDRLAAGVAKVEQVVQGRAAVERLTRAGRHAACPTFPAWTSRAT